MGNSSGADMFNDHLHLRVIRKTPILLFKSKMGRVKMHNEGWRAFGIFSENIGRGFHCNTQEELVGAHYSAIDAHWEL